MHTSELGTRSSGISDDTASEENLTSVDVNFILDDTKLKLVG